jgi:hypothetical protein
MEHQFFMRKQNLKLYRSLVDASEAAAAKADARQEKLLKLLALSRWENEGGAVSDGLPM